MWDANSRQEICQILTDFQNYFTPAMYVKSLNKIRTIFTNAL